MSLGLDRLVELAREHELPLSAVMAEFKLRIPAEAYERQVAKVKAAAAAASKRPAVQRYTPGRSATAKLRYELAGWELAYDLTYVRRFLCSALAARDVGALLLLAGTTGTGKTAIVRAAGKDLTETQARIIPVRPEWLQAADLLGYVNPIRRLFAPSEFVHAVRQASAAGDDLFLLLLDELNLARIESYGADLLSVLERDDDRALTLYPPDQNRLWSAELERLQQINADELTQDQVLRLAELRDFFGAAGGDISTAHRLEIPWNITFLGTLNTDAHTAELSPKVIDRSFVLQSAPPPLNTLFEPIFGSDPDDHSPPPAVELPERADIDIAIWRSHPAIRDGLRKLLQGLEPHGVVASRRLARNAAAYLAYARDQTESESAILADLAHLLIMPRIALPLDAAGPMLDVLEPWVEANAPSLSAEVAALRAQADSGRFGDVRGLR